VLALLAESLALLEAREPNMIFARAHGVTPSPRRCKNKTSRLIHLALRPFRFGVSAPGRLRTIAAPAGQLASRSRRKKLSFSPDQAAAATLTREPQDHQLQLAQSWSCASKPVECRPASVPMVHCARDGSEQPLAGQTIPELRLPNFGTWVTRYLVK